MALYIAMRSSVLSMATCSASARSDSAPTTRSAVDCAQPEVQPSRKTQVNSFMDSPFGWGRMPSRAAYADWQSARRLTTCPTFLLAGRHALTVGAVLLAMEITGVRRRMGRGVIERGDIVLIHAVA